MVDTVVWRAGRCRAARGAPRRLLDEAEFALAVRSAPMLHDLAVMHTRLLPPELFLTADVRPDFAWADASGDVAAKVLGLEGVDGVTVTGFHRSGTTRDGRISDSSC